MKTKLTHSDSCFGKFTLALCRGDCEGDEWNWGYGSCVVQARLDGTSISISHRSQQSGCDKYGEKLVDLVYILKTEPKGIVGVLNATKKKRGK